MSEPVLIDLEALLAPIEGDSPAGPNLTRSPLFDKINELRTTDDPGGAVDESVGRLREGQARVADWPKAIALCKETLAGKSKDLTLVAWLSEGLARQHGLQGVLDGILLLKAANERLWPDLHPQIVDNDLEPRAIWFERFDRFVNKTLADLPLTVKVDGEEHGFWEWQNAQRKGELASQATGDSREELIAEANELRRLLDRAVDKTPRKFYEDLLALAKASQEALEETRNLVDEKFRAEPGIDQLEDGPPTFSGLRKALEEVLYKIEDLLSTKPAPLGSELPGEAGADLAGDADGVRAVGLGPGGPPQSRAEALRRLQEIAAFFHRTEPHSPVSYLVQRAARWGEISLDKWLEEVVGDPTALARIRETLGIKSETEGQSETTY